MDGLKSDLALAKAAAAAGAAAGAAAAIGSGAAAATAVGDDKLVKELEAMLEAKSKELAEANEK